MSTIDPHSTRRIGRALAERQLDMIDAAVARTLEMAWQGRSLRMLGGNPATIERVRPVLDCLSDASTYCGPLGKGSAAKLTNNFLANGILAVAAEAVGIAMESGLALEVVLEVVKLTGTFNKIMLETLPAKAFKGEYAPGFRTALALKDQRLVAELAGELGLDAPVGAATYDVFGEVAKVYPDLDLSSILKHGETRDGFVAGLAAQA